jgi:hypothetical protein
MSGKGLRSDILCDRGWPVDFRYAPLATKALWSAKCREGPIEDQSSCNNVWAKLRLLDHLDGTGRGASPER